MTPLSSKHRSLRSRPQSPCTRTSALPAVVPVNDPTIRHYAALVTMRIEFNHTDDLTRKIHLDGSQHLLSRGLVSASAPRIQERRHDWAPNRTTSRSFSKTGGRVHVRHLLSTQGPRRPSDSQAMEPSDTLPALGPQLARLHLLDDSVRIRPRLLKLGDRLAELVDHPSTGSISL